MKIASLLAVVIYAFLPTRASAQDFSGLTINGAGPSVSEANGQSISPGSTTGFANYNDPHLSDFPLRDFSYANFDNSTLNGYVSGFQACDFDHASFQNASLLALGMSAWQVDTFEFADLEGATLIGNTTSSWQEIDFYHADLSGAIFLGNGTSSFQGIDLQGADLQGANFSGDGLSSFQGINFQGADLQGATFSPSTIFPDGNNYQTTSFNWEASGMILVAAAPEPSSYFLGVVAMMLLTILHCRQKEAELCT